MRDPLSYAQAIDVSYSQKPSAVPWERLKAECNVVLGILRITHGAELDSQLTGHIEAIQKAGLRLGVYVFFRHDQPIKEQAMLAGMVAAEVKPESLWIDVEQDGDHATPVSRSWEPRVLELTEIFEATGVRTGLYLSHLNWGALGSPWWALARPLWVPHYGVREPLTPGGVIPSMWQWTGSRRPPFGGPPLDWSAIIAEG